MWTNSLYKFIVWFRGVPISGQINYFVTVQKHPKNTGVHQYISPTFGCRNIIRLWFVFRCFPCRKRYLAKDMCVCNKCSHKCKPTLWQCTPPLNPSIGELNCQYILIDQAHYLVVLQKNKMKSFFFLSDTPR